jgi:hypothetical protein
VPLRREGKITPEPGPLFVENVRDYFSVITLSAAEQFEAAAEAARPGRRKSLRLADLEVCD